MPWISSDKKPEKGKAVLAYYPSEENIAIAVFYPGEGWFADASYIGTEEAPTHWMPLPEPPKSE